jgi:wyosine [tRNA(Phe)-imidazoG37] synthetase (radical SAM superfamily)
MDRDAATTIAYGPVPSRRLGRSLGINNIPSKSCSYACAYCQVGHTVDLRMERRAFYPPAEILRAVKLRVAAVTRRGERIDTLTFVPDGEPTLDMNLGETIDLLRELELPIAVITNSSLLGRRETRQELARADWVSLKVDAVDETVWRRLNRPHRALVLPAILEGVQAFRIRFSGTLVTETMLVAGMNDAPEQVARTASFVASLAPDVAYLSIPSRPPASHRAHVPDGEAMVRCHDLFAEHVDNVEYLMGYEGSDFASAGDPRADLLGIVAVHPMREDAVRALLARTKTPWSVVEELLSEGSLCQASYLGHTYYLRRPPHP